MPTPTCIDLKDRFGKRYRVTYEESYRAEHGERAWTPNPWLMILPCRNGHIFPWGGNMLAASVDGHPLIAGRLKAMGLIIQQDGSDGTTLLFDVAEFRAVAEVMKPRRRRQLTDEQRTALAAKGAAHRFQGREHGVDADHSAPETHRTPNVAESTA